MAAKGHAFIISPRHPITMILSLLGCSSPKYFTSFGAILVNNGKNELPSALATELSTSVALPIIISSWSKSSSLSSSESSLPSSSSESSMSPPLPLIWQRADFSNSYSIDAIIRSRCYSIPDGPHSSAMSLMHSSIFSITSLESSYWKSCAKWGYKYVYKKSRTSGLSLLLAGRPASHWNG